MVDSTINKGGAPEGNQNAAKSKPWRDAINRALARYGEGSTDGGLNKLADKLIKKCEESDLQALKELGDRIEGKPPQSVELGEDPEKPFKTDIRDDIREFLANKSN